MKMCISPDGTEVEYSTAASTKQERERYAVLNAAAIIYAAFFYKCVTEDDFVKFRDVAVEDAERLLQLVKDGDPDDDELDAKWTPPVRQK